MSETTAEDTPLENDYVPPPEGNPIDDAETELAPLPLGTLEQIQAMLEQPAGVHVVEDGSGGFATVETAPATQPGVDPRWQLPEVLQEDKRVLASETGVQTVGEL